MKKGYILLLLLGMGSLSGMDIFRSRKDSTSNNKPPRSRAGTSPKPISKKALSAEEMRRKKRKSLTKSSSSSRVSFLSTSAPAPSFVERTFTERIKDQEDELLKQLREDNEPQISETRQQRSCSNTSRDGLDLRTCFEDSLRDDKELWAQYLELKLQQVPDPTEVIAREKEAVARQIELKNTLQSLLERLQGIEDKDDNIEDQLEMFKEELLQIRTTVTQMDKKLTILSKLLIVAAQKGMEERRETGCESDSDRLLSTMNTFLRLLDTDTTIDKTSNS